MTERSVFIAALEIDYPDARAAFLDENCESDASLRQRVAALLRAFDGANQFKEQPAVVQELLDEKGTFSSRSVSWVFLKP